MTPRQREILKFASTNVEPVQLDEPLHPGYFHDISPQLTALERDAIGIPLWQAIWSAVGATLHAHPDTAAWADDADVPTDGG